MASSRSPKFIASKLGLFSAVALGSLPMLGAEALAIPGGPPSDTLVVGPDFNGVTDTDVVIEGTGVETPSPISILIFGPFPNQAGPFAIELTEPGDSDISDIVTANLTTTGAENLWTLTVTLTSDAETPLPPPTTPLCTFSGFTGAIPETGQAQHLASDFASCFGLTANNPALPTIDVTSDVSDSRGVPEPSSLALLGAGLAGLGFARRRKA